MAKKKICIDAGHYGKYNRSPVNKKYYESEVMWKLHLLQKKYLEAAGFEVILTRSNQAADMGVYNRGAASKGCDLFISDHSNACGTESVDRPVVIVPLNGKGDDLGRKLADCIREVMGTTQPGKVTTRQGSSGADYYGVIRGAVDVGTVGMILEHSFHTNNRAANWLLVEKNLDKLAKAEAAVIADHFGMTAAAPAAPDDGDVVCALYGQIKVIYTGADGLNVRTSPSMGDNIAKVVHEGYTADVDGITEDGKWYRMADGLFISAGKSYVKFTAGTAVPYRVRIKSSLDIMSGAGSGKKVGSTGQGVFTIVKEKSASGERWGLLKAYQKRENGWISLSGTTRV